MKCPTCNSDDVDILEYKERRCVKCRSCGFDERKEMDEGHDETENVPPTSPEKQ